MKREHCMKNVEITRIEIMTKLNNIEGVQWLQSKWVNLDLKLSVQLSGLILMDVCVCAGIYGTYLFLLTQKPLTSILFLIQSGTALFKLSWNRVAFSLISRFLKSNNVKKSTYILSTVLLFNNIVLLSLDTTINDPSLQRSLVLRLFVET